jgi:hypothetical protein
MRICVLLPDEPKAEQAGLRIRYQRIAAPLAELGHTLSLLPIQNLTRGTLGAHDIYVLSKCYDARALVAMRAIQAAGKRVGADFFDDYFSQSHDSRFARLRYWFREVVAGSDFALCSTPRMRDLVEQAAPTLPVHLMNDPAHNFQPETLRSLLREKLEKMAQTRLISVLWFGIGDNPNFPVGLRDLATFGDALDRLRHRGFAVHLKILTNQRAMTPRALAGLRRLATEWHLEEWSETREQELLADALVAFLPVNAQNFSIAKSLNRAVTALAAGAQVLSTGFPLYAPLEDFLYTDPLVLLADLERGMPRLRADTVDSLALRFSELADPVHEVRRLRSFLADIKKASVRNHPSAVAVVHGRETLGAVHKLAQRLGGLSVASPLSSASLSYDVRFSVAPESNDLVMAISAKHAPDLPVPWHGDGEARRIKLRDLFAAGDLPDCFDGVVALLAAGTPGALVAMYPKLMQLISLALRRVFPQITCFYSEQARDLAWYVESPRHA